MTGSTNPFDAIQKAGKPKTLKWCIWEVLKDHPDGTKVAEVIEQILGRGLYEPLKKAKNAVAQVTAELGKDRHFARLGGGVWAVARISSFTPPPTGEAPGSSAAGTAGRAGAAARRTLPPGSTPGTESSPTEPPHTAEPGMKISAWWEGEGKYYEGRIEKVADEERGIWSVRYADGSDEWMRPTGPLRLTGRGRHAALVVDSYQLYVWDRERQAVVEDRDEGLDPAVVVREGGGVEAGAASTSPPLLPPGFEGAAAVAKPPLAGAKRKSTRASASPSTRASPSGAGEGGGSEGGAKRAKASGGGKRRQTPPLPPGGQHASPPGMDLGAGRHRGGRRVAPSAAGTDVSGGRTSPAPAPSGSDEDDLPLVEIASLSRQKALTRAGSASPSAVSLGATGPGRGRPPPGTTPGGGSARRGAGRGRRGRSASEDTGGGGGGRRVAEGAGPCLGASSDEEPLVNLVAGRKVANPGGPSPTPGPTPGPSPASAPAPPGALGGKAPARKGGARGVVDEAGTLPGGPPQRVQQGESQRSGPLSRRGGQRIVFDAQQGATSADTAGTSGAALPPPSRSPSPNKRRPSSPSQPLSFPPLQPGAAPKFAFDVAPPSSPPKQAKHAQYDSSVRRGGTAVHLAVPGGAQSGAEVERGGAGREEARRRLPHAAQQAQRQGAEAARSERKQGGGANGDAEKPAAPAELAAAHVSRGDPPDGEHLQQAANTAGQAAALAAQQAQQPSERTAGARHAAGEGTHTKQASGGMASSERWGAASDVAPAPAATAVAAAGVPSNGKGQGRKASGEELGRRQGTDAGAAAAALPPPLGPSTSGRAERGGRAAEEGLAGSAGGPAPPTAASGGGGGGGGFRIPKREQAPTAAAVPAAAPPAARGGAAVGGDGKGQGGAQQAKQGAAQRGDEASASAQRVQQESRGEGGRRAVAARLLARNLGCLARRGDSLFWPATPGGAPAIPSPAPLAASAAQHALQRAVKERYSQWCGGALLQHNPSDGFPQDSPKIPPRFPPDRISCGRILVTSNVTLDQCLERMMFISKHPWDIHNITRSTMLLVHNFDEKLVYGCFQCVESGENLDDSFGRAYKYQVRVKRLAEFDPIPDTLLEVYVPRKRHPETRERMKFFEKNFDQRVARDIWQAFAHYHQTARFAGSPVF